MMESTETPAVEGRPADAPSRNADLAWIVAGAAALWALLRFHPAAAEVVELAHLAPEIVAGMVAVGAALVLGGRGRDASPALRRRQSLGAALLVPGLALLAAAIGGEHHHGKAAAPVPWRASFEEALAEAGREDKRVLVDFYADWCAACRDLERRVLGDPDVARDLAAFVPVRVDLTRATPDAEALAARYGVAVLPTVALLDARGKVLPGGTIEGLTTVAGFRRALRRSR